MFHEKTILMQRIYMAKEQWEEMAQKYAKHLSTEEKSTEDILLQKLIESVAHALETKYKDTGSSCWSGINVLFRQGALLEKTAFMRGLDMLHTFSPNVECMRKIAGLSVKVMHKVILIEAWPGNAY